MIGTYVPGTSPLHRAPAWVKLVLLVLVGGTVGLVGRPAAILAALLLVVVAYRFARLGWATPWRQVRPLLWLLLFTLVFHLVTAGWREAVVVVGRVVVLVLVAALVTLTTRTTDLVDVVVACVRPLRRWIDPERLGLMLALGIRCVPVVVTHAVQVRDAQRARGLGLSPRAFAVPLVVRSLRHADALGDALVARGVED